MSIPDITKTDKFVTCHQVTATIPTAGANASAAVAVTLAGVKVGDTIVVSGPTAALTHLAAVLGSVTATDEVTLVGIADGTGYTGASKTYNVEVHHKS